MKKKRKNLLITCDDQNKENHGRKEPKRQANKWKTLINSYHDYAASKLNTSKLTVFPTNTDPLIKALLEQNETSINGLFTLNARNRERAFTPSDGSKYLVMPNFLSILPEFNGCNGNQAAEYWFAVIKGMSKLHRWSDANKVEIVRSKKVDWSLVHGTKIYFMGGIYLSI